MKRYMRLEGLLPSLVSNPWGKDPLNYVGLKRKNWNHGECPAEKVDRYDPCTKVYQYHASLVKAVKRGALKQHGKTFTAPSLTDAMKTLTTKSKKVTPKKDEG